MKANSGLRQLSTAFAGVMMVFIVGCNKPVDAAGTPAPGTTVGTVIDDSVITTKVKTALLDNTEVKSFGLKVETRKGEVQLSGFVDNQAQLDRAVAITSAVEGVKNVLSNVSLKGAPRTVGNKVDDGIITTQVKAAMISDTQIKSLDIAVVTRSGEVQLSGFVDNQAQIDRALEVARGVGGVSNVSNQLSIKK